MSARTSVGEAGFTLVELLVAMTVFVVIALSFLGLFTTLLHSTVVAKHQAVALTLATNQMEYLKSLPYNNLAVSGGSIIASSYIPATTTKTVNNVPYTITTSISYVDDAYDGCGSYPNATLKAKYCRGYSSSTTTTTDTNPGDYKIAHVSVNDSSGTTLAQVDTEIAARVAETASSTGAIFVSVVDGSGNPISGASVQVTDSTVTPAVNVSDSTDSNGIALFYDLTPDTGTDYVISASKSGYSSLTTINVSGTLQPTYPNQKILTQQSSYATLVLKPQGANSLVIETTDTSGNPLTGAKIYAKGGYKKYTSTSDTTYYYDNMTGGDTRPTTDSSGLAAITNLVPGNYIFCGDAGATSCSISGTTYYLAAAVPYGGSNTLYPVTVPTYDPNNPPSTTFAYGGSNYLQKVRLMLTNKSNFPRLNTLTPASASLSSTNINSFPFTLSGTNLTCSSNPASCATSVKFMQGAATYTASCTGTSGGTSLSCTVNLSSATSGGTQLVVSNSNGTLTLPTTPLIGGIVVGP